MRAVSFPSLGLLGLVLVGCNGGPDGPPTLEISETELDFGDVPIQTSADMSFTVSNSGTDEFEVLSVSLVAGDFDLWDITREGPDILTFGDELVVTVTFSPDEEADEIGQVQVRTDIVGTESVDLTATGSAGNQDEDGDGFSPADGDCNDARDDIYPGAQELCDGRDNDCDGSTPTNETDGDSDGFRLCDSDCDDEDGNVYPGAPEICDDKDSDCDGTNSDRTDRDGDGETVCDGDCDDDEPAAFSSATEVCDDQIDNDCDGFTDVVDADGDGHSLCGVAGDCDDQNATIYPIVVDNAGVSPGDGTDATPYTDINTGLANIVQSCPDLYVAAGTYELSSTWSAGEVRILGTGLSDTTLAAATDDRHLTVTGGSTVTIDGVTLSGGAPLTGDGGAVDVSNGTLILRNSEVRDNIAPSDGGAIVVANGTLTVSDTRFTLNSAGDDGGAVALFSATLQDTDTVFTNNTARDGGAVLASSSTIESVNATIAGNNAARQGGGAYVLGSNRTEFLGAQIAQNTAATGGGGLSLVNVGTGYVRNSIVQDNDGGSEGGGILVTGTSVIDITNNTIVANDCATGAGGIAMLGTPSGSEAVANILMANGGTSGLEVTGGAVASFNTGWQNTGIATTEFAGNAAEGADDNIMRNPSFVAFTDNANPADDNLTLTGGSPEIDSGPADSAYNDTDNSQNDRGHTGGPLAAP